MCLSQIIQLYVLPRAVCQLNRSKTRTNFYKNTLVGETWSPPCHCVGGILGCEQERGLIPSGGGKDRRGRSQPAGALPGS